MSSAVKSSLCFCSDDLCIKCSMVYKPFSGFCILRDTDAQESVQEACHRLQPGGKMSDRVLRRAATELIQDF